MKKGEKTQGEGFTVIEVALVLAIAGLIFLMVFVALPGLRTSQRDAERREAVTTFLENVKKYQTNNRGALPGSSESSSLDDGGSISVKYSDTTTGSATDTKWAGFYKKYLGGNFVDPDGDYYKLKVVGCGSQVADQECVAEAQYTGKDISFPNNYEMLVVLQASCSGEKAIRTGNPRKLAVIYKLEGAGIYCANT